MMKRFLQFGATFGGLLLLWLALFLAPAPADAADFRYNLNSSLGFTHVGGAENKDEYLNFSASGFYELDSKVFFAGLCATEGAPGELAWSTPSTWKRGYCDVAAGYFVAEANKLRVGAFGFVGQQFKITTPDGGFRGEAYPMRWGGGLVVYFGTESWLYAAAFSDKTLREDGVSFGALFQTNLLKLGKNGALASRTRVTVGTDTIVAQEAVFGFGG